MRRLLIILLLSLPMLAYAGHKFEAGVHVGAAGWGGEYEYVQSQAGLHAGGHLYYNYLSPYIIGFRTGLTLDCHNASLGTNGYQDTYSTIDVDGQRMEISYTVGNLRERHTSWSVSVPLQLAWSYGPFFSATDFFTLYTGAKAVLPFGDKWKQTSEHTALSVYYPAYDNRIEDSYPLAASRDFDMLNSGTLELPKVQWWLALELNYSLPLRIWSRKCRPYVVVGVYFDYCLSQITPTYSDARSLIMLSDTRDGLPLQRSLTPVMTGNRQGAPLVSRCGLYDVGIKVSYAITSYTPPRIKKSRHCFCNRW